MLYFLFMKLFYVLLVIFLSGCVSSKVTRFYDDKLLQPQNKKIFIIMPFKDQENSLEYKEYGKLVVKKLEQQGYKFTTNKLIANYGVRFDFGVDNKKERVGSLSDPNYEKRYSYQPMSIRKTSVHFNKNKSLIENLFTPSAIYYQTYTRFFALNILNIKRGTLLKPEILFEGEITSKGTCNSFSQVSSCMIEGMFNDFPGKSGKSKNLIAFCANSFCN